MMAFPYFGEAIMSTFYDVLHRLGYSDRKISGIAQLFLMEDENGRNSFDNLVALLGKETLSPQESRWVSVIKTLENPLVIPTEWQSTQVGRVWQSQDVINNLLHRDDVFLMSPVNLFKCLVAISQLQFCVKSPKFGNVTGITNFYELDDRKEVSFAMQQLVKRLGFCDRREYTEEDGDVDVIFLHAATELAVMPRLKTLVDVAARQSHPVTVYYASNPRGLSKTEESTAEILASWFPVDSQLQPQITQCIQAIFDDKSFKPDWFCDLNQLRARILAAVNEQFGLMLTEFPSAPDQEPYPPEYAKAAAMERRDPLDNKWPHIGHLLCHLSQKLQLDTTRIQIQQILVTGVMNGTKYIPCKTWDMLDVYLKDYVTPGVKKLFYISENSVAHSASRQGLMASLMQQKYGIEAECITWHDALESSHFETARIFREVAAELHTIQELLPIVEEKLTKDADMSAPSCSFASAY
jgi:hypothetical protein